MQAPTLHQVETFFKESNYSAAEASKFYYYNDGRGWMINEKMPVKNWQSLANKWMLNPGKYSTTPQPAADPYKDLQYLYKRYKEGENIFRYITSTHFDQLNLQLTPEILAAARQERINPLTGSNQNSVLQMLKAYMENDESNSLIMKDQITESYWQKRAALVYYFINRSTDE